MKKTPAYRDFIGIPFEARGRTEEGCDCWGLVRLWYAQFKGIELPTLLAYASDKDYGAIADIVQGEKSKWKKVQSPIPGDVVVLRILSRECHVGVYLEGNRMLHTHRQVESHIESLDTPRWIHRIAGYYRYEA